MSDLERFESFLGDIDLDAYRKKYKDIKIVELDMPKDIQALGAIYKHYWDNRVANFKMFEEFYEDDYLEPLREKLENFRKKAQFSEETFYRGLPARIYRTWTSLLTQTQGAYVGEQIYGYKNVSMSVNQDYRGRDIIFTIPSIGRCGIQIKKITARKEALRLRRVTSDKIQPINVYYMVPSSGPYTRTGKISKPYSDWEREYGTKLKRLENGFIIFKRPMFETNNLFTCLED